MATQTSVNTYDKRTGYDYKDWEKEYLPEGAQKIWGRAWPMVYGRIGQGFTPQEESQYTGTGLRQINQVYDQSEREMPEILARSGIKVNEGPAIQMQSLLKRDKTRSMAELLANIFAADNAKKEANLAQALGEAHQNYATPVNEVREWGGGTNTTSVSGMDSGGGGFGDILSGAIGGGAAGGSLFKALGGAAGALGPWGYAIPAGMAVLGGLGKAMK